MDYSIVIYIALLEIFLSERISILYISALIYPEWSAKLKIKVKKLQHKAKGKRENN